MIEKMFEALPEWAKGKLIIRIIYTLGSFLTARVIAFLTGGYLANILAIAMTHLAKIGIHLEIKVIAIDQVALQAAITGGLMIAAEFLIHQVHSKVVLPNIIASAPSEVCVAAPAPAGPISETLTPKTEELPK